MPSCEGETGTIGGQDKVIIFFVSIMFVSTIINPRELTPTA